MAEADPLIDQFAQQMRGLHLPEPLSWWPLAPGPWMVIIAVALLVVFALSWLVARRKLRTDHSAAVTELDDYLRDWRTDSNTEVYLGRVNVLLKRIAVEVHGRSVVSRLHGKPWVDWLESALSRKMSSALREALADGCYRASCKVDVAAVHSEVQRCVHLFDDQPSV